MGTYMKINTLLLGAAFAIGASLAALPASANVTVGVPLTGNCYPFECNDSGVTIGQSIDYQQIYSSTAFSGITSFNTITFFDTLFPGPVISGNYTITFSTTTAALGAAFPIAPLANTATFFSGALGGPIGTSFSITGATYNYDPSMGNLVMEVVVNNQAGVPNGSGNGYFDADDSGTATTRAYCLAGCGTSTNDSVGLVTEFSTVSVPEPASWAMMIVGFGLTGVAMRRRGGKTAAAHA